MVPRRGLLSGQSHHLPKFLWLQAFLRHPYLNKTYRI